MSTNHHAVTFTASVPNITTRRQTSSQQIRNNGESSGTANEVPKTIPKGSAPLSNIESRTDEESFIEIDNPDLGNQDHDMAAEEADTEMEYKATVTVPSAPSTRLSTPNLVENATFARVINTQRHRQLQEKSRVLEQLLAKIRDLEEKNKHDRRVYKDAVL
ncbi:hypothetical protein G7Y89_g11132 [Cudoniella acicularis]|uniref:Uncharacterized protein n=1 Tax=Cudoniella acicularis TaxID=354080 RepID=A0A8H4RDS2_9HELO|nr:hypothetical protein G7Y89_g11132 [Cudoniella acicularis]